MVNKNFQSGFSIVEFNERVHSKDAAEVLASSFSHDHWPFWENASPKLALDVAVLMSRLSDLNYVIVEHESGKVYGQIFCMAPLAKVNVIKSLPLLFKIILKGFTGLYFFDNTAWKHLFALRRVYPFLKAHPSNDPHFEVFLFAMHEKMQGKGFGKQLMNAAILEMHKRGSEKVILLTDSTMSWEFYERYGYKRIIDKSIGSAYKIAMNTDQEFGYIYELAVKEKVKQIEESVLR